MIYFSNCNLHNPPKADTASNIPESRSQSRADIAAGSSTIVSLLSFIPLLISKSVLLILPQDDDDSNKSCFQGWANTAVTSDDEEYG